jgi:hypothetical protein
MNSRNKYNTRANATATHNQTNQIKKTLLSVSLNLRLFLTNQANKVQYVFKNIKHNIHGLSILEPSTLAHNFAQEFC